MKGSNSSLDRLAEFLRQYAERLFRNTGTRCIVRGVERIGPIPLAPDPQHHMLAAAKEAIRAISRVAAREWAADGVRVNVVSPIALTPGIEAWSKADPEQYKHVLDGIPLGRLGDPVRDIAPVVAFLAGEESRYVTGQTVMSDGGSIMLR